MKTVKEFKKKLKKHIREYLPYAIINITDDAVYVNFKRIHHFKSHTMLESINLPAYFNITAEDELVELISSWAYYKIKGKWIDEVIS